MVAKKKTAFLREAFLVSLIIASLSLIALTIWALKKGASQSGSFIITALSAVASSVSAIGALYIAVRGQSVDRERDRKKRNEEDESRARKRSAVASLYGAEISAWLIRRDLRDFLMRLNKVEFVEDLKVAPLLGLQLAARDSILHNSGVQTVDQDRIKRIAELSRKVCVELELSAFNEFALVPSIWTTQFKREDVDLLGEAAPVFFVTMGAVWTNLTLATKQIPSAETTSAFMQRGDAPTVEDYTAKLVNYIIAVRGLFADFLTVAEKCAKLLAEDNGADPLQGLKLPAELVVKSRDVSPGLAELYQRMEYREMMSPDNELTSKFKEALEDTGKIFEKGKELFKEINEETRAKLHEMQKKESATAESQDATAKPDPPASSS